jgi:hypothetical protein
VGYTYQSKEQKEDIQNIFVDEKGKKYKAIGKLDYVSCWYFKAAQYMQGTNIRGCFRLDQFHYSGRTGRLLSGNLSWSASAYISTLLGGPSNGAVKATIKPPFTASLSVSAPKSMGDKVPIR